MTKSIDCGFSYLLRFRVKYYLYFTKKVTLKRDRSMEQRFIIGHSLLNILSHSRHSPQDSRVFDCCNN